MHLNHGPMTEEDNRVHDCQKVHGWKACTKAMEVVPQKFKYKQKDNRGSTIEGVYTLGCVDVHVYGVNRGHLILSNKREQ